MRIIAAIITITLLLTTVLTIAHAQPEGTLLIQVLTPDGKGKDGITVEISRGEFTQQFVSNATGWAIFKNIEPGNYLVRLVMGDIILNETSVSFPEQNEVKIVAPLANLLVKVIDLGGKEVPNLLVKITAPSELLVKSRRTSPQGTAIFENIPFTVVPDIGGNYNVEVLLGNITVASENIKIDEPAENATLTAQILSLNLTITNLEGKRPVRDLEVVFSTEKYNKTFTAKNGFLKASEIISSELVGPYKIEIFMRFLDKRIAVYEDSRSLTQYEDFSIVADLGTLTVNVSDSDGNPLPDITLLMGNELVGNFTRIATGEDGSAVFRDLPLSTTPAGTYRVTFFRGAVSLGSIDVELNRAETTVSFTIPLLSLTLKITDYQGKPVADAQVKIIDPFTERVSEALTDSSGESNHKIFPGPNDVVVEYDGKAVFSKRIDIRDNELELRVMTINFPITIRVVDALNNYVSGLTLLVKSGDKVVFEGTLAGSPITITQRTPDYITIDVLKDGDLLVRERLFVAGASDVDVRLVPYLVAGGSLIPVDTPFLAASALILVLLIGLAAWNFVKRQR